MTGGELDEFTLRRIFIQDVRPTVFLDAAPSVTPRAVLVGAQLGAMRTQAIRSGCFPAPPGQRAPGGPSLGPPVPGAPLQRGGDEQRGGPER